MIEGVKRRRKESSEDDGSNTSDYSYVSSYSTDINYDEPIVDLSSLQMNTLKRYKKYYRLHTKLGINKAQLADILSGHFHTINVDEKEAIAYFVYMVKSNSNKLDHNKPVNSSPSAHLAPF